MFLLRSRSGGRMDVAGGRSVKPWVLVLRGILRDADGRYLLLQRSLKSKGWPGHWEFPGGKVDPGEEVSSALKREFLEETGFEIELVRVLTGFGRERDKDHLVYLVFEVRGVKGELRISDEHEQSGWFSKTEVLRLLVSPPLVELVKTLDE
jgi:8-oxo-dGTP diphosphatase